MPPPDPKSNLPGKSPSNPAAAPADASANPLAGPVAGALLEAAATVLAPLVRLLIAKGVTYQVASELLKRVYVRAGLEHYRDTHNETAPTGTQLSLLTGLNRKEIRRLTDESTQAVAPAGVTSHAAAVHATWLTAARYQASGGGPAALARHARGQADALTFDDLVKSITTDHRPTAVLEELLRLGLVEEVESSNGSQVILRDQPFLPRASFTDRLVPLAENLGDHASAAVSNVLTEDPPFLERSVFSDELSAASVRALQQVVSQEWLRLHDELIAAAVAREDADAKSGATTDQRMRVGLYFYSESTKKDAT